MSVHRGRIYEPPRAVLRDEDENIEQFIGGYQLREGAHAAAE